MATKLTFMVRVGDDEALREFTQLPIKIGRAESSDIVVPAPRAGNRHAMISDGHMPRPNDLVLIDLGSDHSTSVNGVKICRRATLKAGDTITVGEALITLIEIQELP